MRWDRLFDDLEGQLEAAHRDAFDAEIADRTRREVALVHMADRLAGARGCEIRIQLLGSVDLIGVVSRVGGDWLLLEAGRSEYVIRIDAVLAADGLPGDAMVIERGRAAADLGEVLRMIARDRSPVTVRLLDGASVEGTVDRVGADFIDVAVHPVDEPRRGAPRRVTTIATGAVVAICCR